MKLKARPVAVLPRLQLSPCGQLNRCCGRLTEATTERIQALPLEALEALAVALLDFSGPSDLAAWLAEYTG